MVKTRSKYGKALCKTIYSNSDKWKPGTYIWSCMNKLYWPGIVVSHKELNFKAAGDEKSWIFWFGDYRVSQMKHKDLYHFGLHFHRFYHQKRKTMSRNWQKGVFEAIREYGLPDTLEFSREQKEKNQDTNDLDENSKIGASNGIKEFLKYVVNGTKDIRDICLACYSADVIDDHPLFEGCVCMDCKKKMQRTYFVIGEDNIKYFCAVCAHLGNMVVCSTRGCALVYCFQCLDDLCSLKIRQAILKEDPWFCFICNPTHHYPNSLIRSRTNWKNKIQLLFSYDSPVISRPPIPVTKKPIRVLSLFDGIATGLTALLKLNITVECYYSCEIDDDSIAVVKKNYPGGVTLLGDVRCLTEDDIKNILPIDLLIGGSPCNDLSLANPYRKGLYDPDGTGVLFFEFYRILTNLQMYNFQPFFWFYENVASMSIQSRVSITRFLQCEPQHINAAWVSSQFRPRLFWGNLLSLQNQQFIDNGPNLQHYLIPGRKASVDKLRTVTTRSNSLKQGTEMKSAIVNSNSKAVDIDIIELEEIFGFPRNYTKVGDLTKNDRQKLLGRAWSVQTICMLLRFLQQYYQQYKETIS